MRAKLNPGSDDLKARAVVLRHGRNAASYQIVNPVIRKWFSSLDDAVVGYVDRLGVRVVAGAPVCGQESRRKVVDEFESASRASDRSVCYFGVEGQFGKEWARRGPETWVCLGAQPCWRLGDWNDTVTASASLRMQFNRARHKGVRVEEWTTERALNSPELETVLQRWLAHRGLPPLHFLVEPQTLGFLEDRRTFVAVRNGQAIAFLNLCPIPGRHGWLTEQFPRLPDAPNGTVELLMHEAALALAIEGWDLLTMGMVPLSKMVDPGEQPGWFKAVAWFARAHGRRFYNFEGLETFKAKFHPHWWEPLHVIVDGADFRPKHLRAVCAAFVDGPLWVAALRGIGRAVHREVETLAQAMKARP